MPANLATYTLYNVSVASTISDVAGNLLSGSTAFTFRTNSDLASQTSPSYIGNLNLNVCSGPDRINFKATYSRAMNPVTADQYSLTHYYTTESGPISVSYPSYNNSNVYRKLSSCVHDEMQPNPNLAACLLAAFNCGGLYAICAAGCYAVHPTDIPVYNVPDATCSVMQESLQYETIPLPGITGLNGDTEIVWQGYQTLPASSTGHHFVFYRTTNPTIGIQDYDGYTAVTPAYGCSAGIPLASCGIPNPIPVGNSCP